MRAPRTVLAIMLLAIVPAPARAAITLTTGANTATTSELELNFGDGTGNVERLDGLKWRGGANLAAAGGGGPACSPNEPLETWGQSYGYSTPVPVLVAAGSVGTWTVRGGRTAELDSHEPQACFNDSVETPVRTRYTFFDTGAAADKVRVERRFGFGATTPSYMNAQGLRAYVPRMPGAYTQVVHPNSAGSALVTDATCGDGCVSDDWDGTWLAINEPQSNAGMVVLRDPANLSPAKLMRDNDAFSGSNNSGVTLTRPANGWKEPLTETEYLCFYDAASWPPAGRAPDALPPGCSAAAVPVSTAVPTISGTAARGSVLTASPGTWEGQTGAFAYRWARCASGACTAIPGATGQTYTVGDDDAGRRLQVTVTATAPGGETDAASSAPTAEVPEPPPVTASTAGSVSGPEPQPATTGTGSGDAATIIGFEGGRAPFGPPPALLARTALRTLDARVTATGRGSRVLVDTGRQVVCAAGGPRCALKVSWTAKASGTKRSNGELTRAVVAGSAELVRFPLGKRAARVLRDDPLSLAIKLSLRSGCPAEGRQARAAAPCKRTVTRMSALLPPRVVPTPPSGCSVQGKASRYARGPGTAKVVALTFDDGPERNTEKFLDLLKAKDVKATFFPVGRNIAGREKLLKRALYEGHVFGNHTVTHRSVNSADATAASELDNATKIIRAATGFTPCLFRPPNGAESPALLTLVTGKGMTTISADVDPSDWEIDIDAATIRTRVLGGVSPGSIVIMHEDYSSDSSLEALGQIIDQLQAQGYGFVTVPELLAIPLRYPGR